MRKYIKAITLTLLIVLCSFGSVDADERRVFDDAGLLSEERIEQLEDKIIELQEMYNIDIVIHTTYDLQGKDVQTYADDYYDYNGYQDDGILVVLDMSGREIQLSETGKMESLITDKRDDEMLDAMFVHAKAGDYEEMFATFLDEVESIGLETMPTQQQKMNKFIGQIPIFFIASVASGVAIVVFMAIKGRNIKSSRLTRYLQLSEMKVENTKDDLFDSKTTTTIIRTQNYSSGGRSGSSRGGSSGRSSSRSSSSGRSHSGGSRRF